MKEYIVLLPNFESSVNILSLPINFDNHLLHAFAKYTHGTAAEFRDVDKLKFIDLVNKATRKNKYSDEIVNNRVVNLMKESWENEDSLIDEDDIYCRDFLEECCEIGMCNARLGINNDADGVLDKETITGIAKFKIRVIKLIAGVTEENLKTMNGEDDE